MPRFAHLMTTLPDATPILLGLGGSSEIYNAQEESWKSYMELPGDDWSTLECLVSVGGMVYHIEDEITELDLGTWTHRVVAQVPEEQKGKMGRCAAIEVDGQQGEMKSNRFSKL